ncbi:MAG: histone deacetylase [Deltaproteobacteria bacterium RIFOXYD12_FULL_50_9]|nr:MAG: histone deacetylase [Deltaproteobacteria bacterium RIFOXYD12_FULL_50_9]
MKTAVFAHDLFLQHDPGYGHVESPERLEVIYSELERRVHREQLLFPTFEAATPAILELNHAAGHVRKVAATADKIVASLDPDTFTSPRSYEAACLAAGAVVEGMRLLAAGEIENGFALVRPPGHHAEYNAAKGFCLFNNVAVAARYALADLGMERILIVDWDLHHGNGTQHSFYDTDQVLYFSTHQYPYYPGSGALDQTGIGRGVGYTINVPLPGGQGDGDFVRIFDEILCPVARQYRPDCIIVSAGFDIYHDDPLGGMGVTVEGFAALAAILKDLAAEVCGGRILFALEGGYNLQGLRNGVLAVLGVLSGSSPLAPEILPRLRSGEMPFPSLEAVRNIAKHYWIL